MRLTYLYVVKKMSKNCTSLVHYLLLISVQIHRLWLSLFCNQTIAIILIIIFLLLKYKFYNSISAGHYIFSQQYVRSTTKARSSLTNAKVGTYEGPDSFPKTDFLTRMPLPNPLGDPPKFTFQRNSL